MVTEEKSIPVLLDYVEKADLQYTYENGIRMIHLPEVVVKGTLPDKTPYYSIPDHSYSAEKIEQHGSIKNLLYLVPGVKIIPEINGYNK